MQIHEVIMVVPWSLIAASIAANASLVAGYEQNKKNRKSQEEQNRLDRENQRYLYELSTRDARENAMVERSYNSPEQQMNRLRQAGLNPNLVYGRGADNTAGSISSGSAPSGSLNAPMVDYGFVNQAAETFMNVNQQSVQTDLIHEQAALARKEQILKDATTQKTLQDTATSAEQLRQSKGLWEQTIKKAELENWNLGIKAEIELDRNQREALRNTADVAKTYQEITQLKLKNAMNPLERAKLKQDVENAKQENRIRSITEELKEIGIYPGDPKWFGLVQRKLQKGVIESPLFKSNSNLPPWFLNKKR